jgi:hypothetical protein
VSEAIQSRVRRTMDCFVAEPVIGRTFARPVGSSQWRWKSLRLRLREKIGWAKPIPPANPVCTIAFEPMVPPRRWTRSGNRMTTIIRAMNGLRFSRET